jgi:hypothetical protein
MYDRNTRAYLTWGALFSLDADVPTVRNSMILFTLSSTVSSSGVTVGIEVKGLRPGRMGSTDRMNTGRSLSIPRTTMIRANCSLDTASIPFTTYTNQPTC